MLSSYLQSTHAGPKLLTCWFWSHITTPFVLVNVKVHRTIALNLERDRPSHAELCPAQLPHSQRGLQRGGRAGLATSTAMDFVPRASLCSSPPQGLTGAHAVDILLGSRRTQLYTLRLRHFLVRKRLARGSSLLCCWEFLLAPSSWR